MSNYSAISCSGSTSPTLGQEWVSMQSDGAVRLVNRVRSGLNIEELLELSRKSQMRPCYLSESGEDEWMVELCVVYRVW